AAQLLEREQRRLAELREIREHGDWNRTGESPVFVEAAKRLGENHVGSCIHVLASPVDGGRQTFDGMGVGSRHDHERWILSCVDGGLEAVAHLLGADERLAGSVSAAFGGDLVFQM